MKHEVALSLRTSIVASFLLYWIAIICFEFIYPFVTSDRTFAYLLIFSVLMGAFVAIVSLKYKNNSIVQAALRFIVLLIGYVFWMLLNGYIGIIRYLQSVFGMIRGNATNNGSGMLLLTYTVSVFFVCLFAILIWCLSQMVHKRIRTAHEREIDP